MLSGIDANALMTSPTLRVLLVGEGDFSFAVAFATIHTFCEITATELRSEAETVKRYPHAAQNIQTLRLLHVRVLFGVDARDLSPLQVCCVTQQTT